MKDTATITLKITFSTRKLFDRAERQEIAKRAALILWDYTAQNKDDLCPAFGYTKSVEVISVEAD